MSLKQIQFIEADLKKLLETSDLHSLEKLKNAHVSITGGSGFVGTWLLELIHYLNKNHGFNTHVTAIDRDFNQFKKVAPHLQKTENMDFLQADSRYLVELPKESNYIIHCAGTPDNRIHASNPVDVMSTCALGTERVLQATDRLSDLRMFTNLTSSLVYGNFDHATKPIQESETLTSDGSFSPYTAGKLYSEVFTSSYRQQFRTPCILLRPFTLIGPYQTLTSPWALNNFIHDAVNGSTIKILGSGNTVRSFLYGADVAFWILTLTLNGSSGSVYNLGSPDAIDLASAAKMVTSHFSSPKEVIYCGGRSNIGKLNFMVPDTTKIQKSFGLKPVFSTSEAIKRSVDWFTLND